MSFFSRISSMWGSPREGAVVGAGRARLLAVQIAEANGADIAGVGAIGFDDEPPHFVAERARNGAFNATNAPSQFRDASDEIRRLVSRVDSHLEQQSRRAERAITMLEGSPGAAESLGILRDQQERLVESLEDIADSCRSTREQGLIAMSHLGAVADRLDKAAEIDERLAEAIGGAEQGLLQVSQMCRLVRDDLSRAKRRQEARDLRLAAMLARSHRLMLTALVVCASGVALMGGAVLLALTLG